MGKKKLDVVELELGVDVTDVTARPKLHPETEENIARRIRLAKQETDAIKRLHEKRDKERQDKEKATEQCFRLLLDANKKGEKVPVAKLITKAGDMTLSTLILRLNNLIKKRGELWKIKKTQSKKKMYYHLTTS